MSNGSTIAASNQVGPEVLKALGIDCKRVLDFSISFKAHDLVTVSVRYAVPSHTTVAEVLRKYRLRVDDSAAPPLVAQCEGLAPIDQQRLGALIRILRGTEDGVRDWLAFGLDPFLAPSENTRARLLDAAETHLRALAGRLEQHFVQDGVADMAVRGQVGDQLAQQVTVPVGLDVGPLAEGVEDAPRDVGS